MPPAEDIRPPEVRLGPQQRWMEPLWDRVDRKRLRLALSIGLFILGSVVGVDLIVVLAALPIALFASLSNGSWSLGTYLGGILALTSLVAIGAATVWSSVALTRSEKWLVRRLGATISPKGDDLPTKMALKDMAIAAGFAPAPASTFSRRPT